MGQVEVSFIENINGVERLDLGIQMESVLATISNSQQEKPLSGDGSVRFPVRWGEVSASNTDLKYFTQFLCHMETIRIRTKPHEGAARIADIALQMIVNLGEKQVQNFVEFLALKATIALLVKVHTLKTSGPVIPNVGFAKEVLGDEMTKTGMIYLLRNCPLVLR